MSLVFPKWTNALPAATATALGGVAAGVVVGVWYYFTPSFWEVGYMPDQPVDYSHQIHVGKLGMDCLYCHTHVEESRYSNVPDTQTCMGCHTGEGEVAYLSQDLWKAHRINENLIALRASWNEDIPIQWRKIHKVPEYAHFNHAVHVNAGVSCYSCHGRIDQMEVVYQVEDLSMGWCLECHRNPEDHLVDVNGLLDPDAPVRVTNLAEVADLLNDPEQQERGLELAERLQLQPPQYCAACHY